MSARDSRRIRDIHLFASAVGWGCVLGLLAALAFVLFAPDAEARDTVPTRARARADMVRFFPASAPTSLLRVPRGETFRTKRLHVERARRCTRTRVQVECSFVALLVARRGQPFDPVRCRGELWAKQRGRKIIGRVGDYVCRSVTPSNGPPVTSDG